MKCPVPLERCCNQWTAVGGLTWEYQLFLQVAWRWLPFTTSARTDSLQLSHWVCLWWFTNVACILKYLVCVLTVLLALLFQVRVVNGVLPTGDYDFAKYNTVCIVVSVTSPSKECSLKKLGAYCILFVISFCRRWMFLNTPTRSMRNI
jgi:hypothetical protein